MSFYDVLKIEYGGCPPGCRACEEACAGERGEGRCAGITAVHLPEVGFHGALTCGQCSEPACMEVCPVGAITKDEDDGIVRIDEQRCIGCGLCTLACPYGGMGWDLKEQRPFKCDRCDGESEPPCVAACEDERLSLLRSRRVVSYLRAQDPFSPGVPNCLGCSIELAMRVTFKVLGKETFIFSTEGCSIFLTRGQSTQAICALPTYICCMTNVPSSATGLKRYYRRLGREARVVAFVGDGAAVDVGFQPLSGAAERGENIIVICADNEGYQATGNQRSGSTYLFSRTATTPAGGRWRGKPERAKNLPLIMAFHRIPYVATATLSHLEDYAQKLRKAMAVKEGMAYIHLLCPCVTGWGFRSNRTIEVCRTAVETNYFPLWEVEEGKFRLTYEVARPKPIAEFTKLMQRYNHLSEEELAQLQEEVDSHLSLIRSLAGI
ncbi:MAG: thiamine pyrophosphate-dependent enzyme [Candidatus Bipolaricaulia bacterium]